MKPFPVPPGRNVASCSFSEQLLGTRHTVLQTGGRNKPEAPDACSDLVYILYSYGGVKGGENENQQSNRMTPDKHYGCKTMLWEGGLP